MWDFCVLKQSVIPHLQIILNVSELKINPKFGNFVLIATYQENCVAKSKFRSLQT